MKKRLKVAGVVGLVAALIAGGAAPAFAATTSYSSEVCAPALRPAIYIATVGNLTLSQGWGTGSHSESWYNSTRTTRVKLTPALQNWMNGGTATYTGSYTNKGQDCRLF